MTDDVLLRFGAFTAAVRARLEKGREAYRETPAATRPMPELVDELMAEAADIAGWSACLWTRLERLRSRLVALGVASAPRPPSEPPGRMVGAERNEP
jgi:hypothetical protein